MAMLGRLRQQQIGQGPGVQNPPPGWSSTLVKRLRLERTLEGHDGCVNTVHFSPDGQLLVSGSDDMQIFFWDWQLGTRTLAFHSGHHNNVFQARIMPHSANSTVVTCAADGLVRVATVQQGSGGAAVGTRRLACHRGRAHKLALEPGSPHCFLSCDGEVRHFDLRHPAAANRRLLACRTQRGRLELNSVHCRLGTTQFCVAGGDPFVRIFDLRRVAPSGDPLAEPLHRLAPWHLRGRHSLITVTCAVFSQGGQLLASYNDENIYLFAAEEQQQQQAAAADRANASSGDCRAAAGASAGRAGAERGGGSSRQGNKRGRSSGAGTAGGGSGSERGDADRQADADAGVRRTQQRRAATAALAQAQYEQAASPATAAAQAHASIRRGLLHDEVAVQDEAQPPLPLVATDAAAGGSGSPGGSRQPDAVWLDQLPRGRHGGCSSQQQGGHGQEGGEGVGLERGRGQARGSEQGGSEQEDAGGGSGGGSGSELDNIDAELAAEAEPFDLDAAMEESEEEESEEEESEEEESEEEDEFEDEGELPQARPGHLDPGALVDDADAAPRAGQRGGAPSGNVQDGHPDDSVLQTYKGHRNYRTVKGVSFLGRDDEFVMSGSDCGHIYVWERDSGVVQAVLKGDADTVNCLEPHPQHLLTMATSGIEDSIKLWAPTAEEPQVLGAAAERRMAANQAAQGEERRMFISPEMLQLLLRSRQLEAMHSSDSEEGEEEDEDDEDVEGRRHHADCAIM
ncbi:hypothetical protein CHLNCDRAFT_135819 [Chlorella variabilis]|uniref:DDB1-and CUL4-associated factor 8 n=1 Tax=Chlorella variabilis TaxID=554065 RepID=E1ZJ25_CHLVA|nr:hypothetical protein CHLNCDRAFT_135819 [Chlorella variabilis]EFN54263.1 hypothetical protein CHLNCDRAFT_135819 [Chlorella variabilis]|eukprot:XP_005846365.1 hypothetical protein CHLNCDRAFT_135819 [Chlorella variabilis]